MGKARIVLLALLGIVVAVGIVLAIFNFVVPKGAGILIETNPPSAVFINGEEVGRTPYTSVRKPGEITVKLIPDSFGQPLPPYETKTALISGVQTVIRREFGPSDEVSQGELVSFEKGSKGEAGITVVTIPENTQISIDGQVRGFSPFKTSSVGEGEHSLTASASGYISRSIQVKTITGFKLIALIKLSVSSEAQKPSGNISSEESKKEEEKTQKVMVKILTTPTGFLRVRSEPSMLGKEVGQVKPGETYEVVETDTKTGWFKIIFAEGKEGWVTNQYAKIVDEATISPTVTPTIKPSPTPTKTIKITPTSNP